MERDEQNNFSGVSDQGDQVHEIHEEFIPQDQIPEIQEELIPELEENVHFPNEEVEKPKKRSGIAERLNEVQRARFKALEETRLLREENERLRALAHNSTKTALDHYDKAVINKIQIAKEKKIKALETGDINAQTDADIELSSSISEYQNLANMRASNQYYNNPYPYNPPPNPTIEVDNTPIVEQWASDNTWAVPTSEDYDEIMAQEVNRYCAHMNYNLEREGLSNEIYSPDYFDLVDNYVENLKNNGYGYRKGGNLRMKQSRGTVNPVRGGYNSAHQNGINYKTQMGLTPDERELARVLKVPEKVYLQHKIEDRKLGKHLRGR